MTRYIAFLRAINVGSHTVKMDHLRRLFEGMGFTGVETFIASGNVIFETTEENPAALELQIEAALHEALGYKVATFLRTPAELAAVAGYKPFKAADLEEEGIFLYIAFVGETPSQEAQQKLQAFTTEVDEFHIQNREIYWLCRKKISESKFSGAMLEKALGLPATMRNVTTIKRMALKYSC